MPKLKRADGDLRPYIGFDRDGSGFVNTVETAPMGMTASGLYVPIRVTEEGRVVTELSGSNALIQGNISLTGSAQQLPNTPCRSISIQADPDNQHYVYIGNASVSETAYMFKLEAGQTAEINCSNANMVYVLGTAGEKLSYGGEA